MLSLQNPEGHISQPYHNRGDPSVIRLVKIKCCICPITATQTCKPAQEDLRLSSCMLCASILSALACTSFLNSSLAVLMVTLNACWSHWIASVAYNYPGLQHPITPNPQSAFNKKDGFLLGIGEQCVNPRHLAGRRLVNGELFC